MKKKKLKILQDFIVFFLFKNIMSMSNDSITNNTDILSPIKIDKKLIEIPNECNQNYYLYLLNYDFRNLIIETLSEFPQVNGSSNYCKLLNKNTCCTSGTFKVMLTQFENFEISSKLLIFKKNLNIYNRIVAEHYRNLKNFYQFEDEQFENLFSEYKYYVKNITQIAQEIVKESLYHKWTDLCDMICYPQENEYCKAYNVTYYFNETFYYDLNFECETKNSNRAIRIKKLTTNFMNFIGGLLNKINKFYSDIKNKIPEILNANNNTKVILSNNVTYTLLNNSINDGYIVSRNNYQNMICESFSDKIINSNLANYNFDYNFTCENILENICLPFECLDNSFMIFNQNYLENQTEILTKTNFTKIILTESKQLINTNYDIDIIELIEGNIIFTSKSFFINSCKKEYLIIYLILIFLFL